MLVVRGQGYSTLLPTALASALHPVLRNQMIIRLILDTGASRTLVSKQVVKTLDILERDTDFVLEGLGKKQTTAAKKVKLILADVDLEHELPIEALVVDRIIDDDVPEDFDPLEVFPQKLIDEPRLADEFPRTSGTEIQMLLGQDFLALVLDVSSEARCPLDGTMFWNTIFGLVIQYNIRKS